MLGHVGQEGIDNMHEFSLDLAQVEACEVSFKSMSRAFSVCKRIAIRLLFSPTHHLCSKLTYSAQYLASCRLCE